MVAPKLAQTDPEPEDSAEIFLRGTRNLLRDMEGLDSMKFPIGNGHGNGTTPSKIGKYTVIGRLGNGGQAEVFRALQPVIEREVVVKWAKGEYSADLINRIRHEARILPVIDDQHVYDLDFHEDRPFLVYDYIRGLRFDEAIEKFGLRPWRTARLLAAVARKVDYVHRKGIVHLDLKPENIVLGNDGRPRVIDFGLALAYGNFVIDPPDPRQVCGTPAYMSPEQARGEVQAIGPQTDVFGLGSVLYTVLVKKAPFDAESITEAIEKAARCDYDRKALKKVAGGLFKICIKAMAVDPAKRFESAKQFAAALDKFADWRSRFPPFWS
jgi:eukaryotic-like serine/threonine-protein kinase